MSADSERSSDTLGAELFGDGWPVYPGQAPAASPPQIGRYVQLEYIGAGGMGVVYAAYDPELDRKVAIKVLRAYPAEGVEGEARRERTLREAKALARLSHPNVVQVYEVGEHGDEVFVAMEFVRGQTLEAWMTASSSPRPWREVLPVFIQAGRGLAAAHAAGLIHRDFKPANVLLGADGRTRVMDFGLAQLQDDELGDTAHDLTISSAGSLRLTRTGVLVGTPAYMSPEQFQGGPVGERTDVFSFSVALWEVLAGERPFEGATAEALARNVLAGRLRARPGRACRAPKWLWRICERGLARSPAQRFPSMNAMVDALASGRSRARTRLWLAGAAAAMITAGSTAAYEGHRALEREAICMAEGDAIREVWGPEARVRVRRGLIGTGLVYAPITADEVGELLNARAEEWREQQTEACRRYSAQDGAEEERERVLWCLDERKLGLEALIAEFEDASPASAQQGVLAAAELEPASPCVDPSVLAQLPSPPPEALRTEARAVVAELSRARARLAAGKYDQGLQSVRASLRMAETLGWTPIIAAAAQVEAALLEKSGAFAEAELAGKEAYYEAHKVSAWGTAAKAATTLAIVVGARLNRHGEGEQWARHAEAALKHGSDPLDTLELSRIDALAKIHHEAGEHAEAIADYAQVLEVRERLLGAAHPAAALARQNLATSYRSAGAHREARILLEEALADLTEALGPDHPDVAMVRLNLGNVYAEMGDPEEAEAMLRRALETWEETLDPAHPNIVNALTRIASIAQHRGKLDDTKRALERIVKICEGSLTGREIQCISTYNELAQVEEAREDIDAAAALFERALEIAIATLGPEHRHVASVLNGLAGTHVLREQYSEAKALYRRALRIWEKTLGPEHPDLASLLSNLGHLALAQGRPTEALETLERARVLVEDAEGIQSAEPHVHFNLSKALLATGDRRRAHDEASAASEAFRELGERGTDLAEVEEFLEKHWP